MRIIGIHGQVGVGKDTVADHLVSQYGFVKIGFADALKEMLKVIGVDPKTREEKEAIEPRFGVTRRSMMETLGTDWMREIVNSDGWIRILESRFNQIDAMNNLFDDIPHTQGIVINDVRMNNEAKWVHDNGGKVWRITRPDVTQTSQHSSNSGLAGAHIDRHIVNFMDVPHLLERVDVLMRG